MKSLIFIAVACAAVSLASSQCLPTLTTASGTRAPAQLCSGQLIFEDDFTFFDQSVWRHENTLSGGGNWEFQWYLNNRANSYTTSGILHLRPTFTADTYGEDFLRSGTARIPLTECTDDRDWGCERTGSYDNIINPILSAKITTINSFAFKYGTLEIRAKLPAGDWLWPALWLLPKYSVYGPWPNSGEIDLVEIRGNRALYDGSVNVGYQQAGQTMHFGPAWNVNGWETTHFNRNRIPGWSENFHTYRLEWNPDYLRFSIDGDVLGTVDVGNGFWERGGWAGSGLNNPWDGAGRDAPFNQEFYVIMNNAVGGTVYFGDHFTNQGFPKPWLNTSPRAAADFWEHRSWWEPTWNMGFSDDSHLQIDYVRIYAL